MAQGDAVGVTAIEGAPDGVQKLLQDWNALGPGSGTDAIPLGFCVNDDFYVYFCVYDYIEDSKNNAQSVGRHTIKLVVPEP